MHVKRPARRMVQKVAVEHATNKVAVERVKAERAGAQLN